MTEPRTKAAADAPRRSGTSPAGRRERHKAETRERLLAAAVEAFVARGYDATTVDQIAEAADVARATAFNYFRRKEDIVAALIEQRRQMVSEAFALEQRAGMDTVTGIRVALSALAGFQERDETRNKALIRTWLRAGAPLMAGWYDNGRVFADAIRAGQAKGEVPPSADADSIGLLLLDAYLGTLYRWASEQQPDFELEPVLLAAVEPVLHALRTAAT